MKEGDIVYRAEHTAVLDEVKMYSFKILKIDPSHPSHFLVKGNRYWSGGGAEKFVVNAGNELFSATKEEAYKKLFNTYYFIKEMGFVEDVKALDKAIETIEAYEVTE